MITVNTIYTYKNKPIGVLLTGPRGGKIYTTSKTEVNKLVTYAQLIKSLKSWGLDNYNYIRGIVEPRFNELDTSNKFRNQSSVNEFIINKLESFGARQVNDKELQRMAKLKAYTNYFNKGQTRVFITGMFINIAGNLIVYFGYDNTINIYNMQNRKIDEEHDFVGCDRSQLPKSTYVYPFYACCTQHLYLYEILRDKGYELVRSSALEDQYIEEMIKFVKIIGTTLPDSIRILKQK